MGKPTGVLDVSTSTGKETYSWNGRSKDREATRAAFNELMKSGSYLAVVFDGPAKATQVRTFEEIEQIERERGVVTAQVSRSLVGG